MNMKRQSRFEDSIIDLIRKNEAPEEHLVSRFVSGEVQIGDTVKKQGAELEQKVAGVNDYSEENPPTLALFKSIFDDDDE